jgi:hypothetical protein
VAHSRQGATLVHWLVASAVIVVSYAVVPFAECHAPGRYVVLGSEPLSVDMSGSRSCRG